MTGPRQPSRLDQPNGSDQKIQLREDQRRALIALAVGRTSSLENRYRAASVVAPLLDPTLDHDDLASTAGITPKAAMAARRLIRDRELVDRTLEQAQQEELQLVCASDPEYPASLNELELPPPCLFCRVNINRSREHLGETLAAPGIGIVGPRNADPYGLEAARLFARDLCEAGLVITSGFARGVDAACHQEAANSARPTIAILGCGIDVPYPRQNQKLIGPICDAGGVVLTEFPFGLPPAPWQFPVRNRLIAAMTFGMLVVQASMRSGSLVSARLALEQGREVFAVPGRIFDVRSKGANQLLKDGAHVAVDAESVLDTLPLAIRDHLATQRLGADGALRQKALLTRLQESPANAENLALDTGLPLSVILSDLTQMELLGEVESRRGGLFAVPR